MESKEPKNNMFSDNDEQFLGGLLGEFPDGKKNVTNGFFDKENKVG